MQLHKRGGDTKLSRDVINQVIVKIDLLQFEAVKDTIRKNLD